MGGRFSLGFDIADNGEVGVVIRGFSDQAADLSCNGIAGASWLRELRVHDEDLEDIFLRMTDGEMGL